MKYKGLSIKYFLLKLNAKRYTLNANQGFTLIELLLYMGVFTILLTILMQVFTSILAAQAESQATSVVSQDGNFIMTRLAHDIASASNVTSPTIGSSGTSLHITGSSVDETLQLTGNNLMLTNNSTGTTDQLNSINTTPSVTFTTLGNGAAGNKPSVKINLTVTSRILRSGNNVTSKVFETTVTTR